MGCRLLYGSVAILAVGCSPAPHTSSSSPSPAPKVILLPSPDAGARVAEVAVAAPEPKPLPVAKPVAPPMSPIDPKAHVSFVSYLAANATHALMLGSGDGYDIPSYVVFDLATKCAVESYREGNVFRTVHKATQPLIMETYYGRLSPPAAAPIDSAMLAALNEPEASAEIRSAVGLANRFGLTSLQFAPLSWNAEGPHVLVVAGLLYHSSDGGRTFRAVDDHPSTRAQISPDGKTAVYERCSEREAIPDRPVCRGPRELVASPLTTLDARAPVTLTPLTGTGGYVAHEGFSKDGHVLVWRTDATHGCLLFIDPNSAAVDRQVCVTDPHFATQAAGKLTQEPSIVKWVGLSPDEGTGALEWSGFRPKSTTYETVILDMKAKAIARTLPDWQFRFLGDNFTALVQSWSGFSDPQYLSAPGQPIKLVHRGHIHDWDSRSGRALTDATTGPRATRTLGGSACKLISVRTIR